MTGVVQCLKRRADAICEECTVGPELRHLQSTFEANGYPRSMVRRLLRKENPPRADQEKDPEDDEERPKLLVLPYLRNTSEQIQRYCERIGVKAVFRSGGTLRQALTRVKTATPEMKKKEVICEVPCMDCQMSYIGETGRNLQKRLTEHKAAVRRGDRKNGIAVHVQDHDHRVDWEAAQVIEQEPRLPYWPRRIREAIHIANRDGATTNLDCGLSLDSIWSPFMNR